MSDVLEGQNPVPEGTTEEPMPSSNKPEEVVVPQTEGEPTLPDGVKERTAEQFEKLKEANKRLAEENAALKTPKQTERPSFFDSPIPTPTQYQGVSQQEIDQKVQSLIDQDGYLNVESLKVELRKAEEAKLIALKAAEESKRTREEVERYGHKQEVSQTYQEFPELDPNKPEFDTKFYDLVTNQIYGQLLVGKKQDYLSAAKEVADKLYNPKANKAQDQAQKAQQVEESKTKKVQAATQVGQGKGDGPPIDQDELVAQSRKGSMDAIYKRLAASGN